MRIVFVCNHFLPSIGGVQLSVHCTAQALSELGHDVVILTETPADGWTKPLPYDIVRFSVPIFRPFTRLLYWGNLWCRRSLFKNADVVHFHDYTPAIHWYLPLFLFVRSPLYAITFHGFEGYPIKKRHQVLRWLASKLCSVRFGVGEFIRRWYRHEVDEVFHGAPVHFSEVAQDAADIETVDFLYIGRLEPDTGILECLTAMDEHGDGEPARIKVRLIGNGTLRPNIASMQFTRLDVEFQDSTDDVAAYISSAKCIIATGYLAVFDALAFGKPVLIPALQQYKQEYFATPEGLGDHAYIAHTVSEMRAHIRTIIASEYSIEQLKSERAQFLARHTWRRIAEMHIDAYQNHENAR
ncbi:MAG: hypothetical protein CL946_09595 [Ectothiorhodospiraceae bacterium]|nr:hypothetical protein [Ectothiorhodospiraceae bacterium]